MESRDADIIKKAVRDIAKQDQSEVYGIPAKVVSVDVAEGTIDVEPIDGTAGISDVRLKPESSEPGALFIPKVDSVVFVTMINDSDGFVSMFSEVDSVAFRTTSGNVVQLQDGSLGGLVIVANMVARMNILENDINSIKSAFSSWVVAPGDGGAALKAAAATWFGTTLTPTIDADIENDKVTHGVS